AEIAANAAGEVARRTRHCIPRLREPVHAHRRKQPIARCRAEKAIAVSDYRPPFVSRQQHAISSGETSGGIPVSPNYVVKPVERAIRVLQCAGAASSPLSLKEISARVGLPKTSVFRYLQTLRAGGLIAHDADRDLYRVGAGILSLVPQGGGLQRLREIALPHMRSLQRRFNETVNLGIVEGVNVVYIEIIESKRAL